MLFTVNLILHEEMALLFQVGATVSAHITFRMAVMVPQLRKHSSAGGRENRAALVTVESYVILPELRPGASPEAPQQPSGCEWEGLVILEASPMSTQEFCMFWLIC